MAVVKILSKYYEGLSTDVKPTGVISGTVFRETDTRATYATYDGDNWVVADLRYRLVNEDGTYVDIPAEFDALIDALEAGFDLAALEATLAIVDTVVDAIRAVTDVTPVLTETGGSITTDGTKQNLWIEDAPAGLFKPICLKIDFTAQTGTETVEIELAYRIVSGGAYVVQDLVEYAGVVAAENKLINIDLEPNRYGVRVTIENTARGTHRAYPWEVFYEAVP